MTEEQARNHPKVIAGTHMARLKHERGAANGWYVRSIVLERMACHRYHATHSEERRLYVLIYSYMWYWGRRMILGQSATLASPGRTLETHRSQGYRYTLRRRIAAKSLKVKELESWLSAQR
jgi:hypothetical protein